MKNVKETVAEQLAQGFYLSTVPLLTDNKAPWRRCLLAIMQKSISNNACVRTCAETRDWSVSAQTCLLLVWGKVEKGPSSFAAWEGSASNVIRFFYNELSSNDVVTVVREVKISKNVQLTAQFNWLWLQSSQLFLSETSHEFCFKSILAGFGFMSSTFLY